MHSGDGVLLKRSLQLRPSSQLYWILLPIPVASCYRFVIGVYGGPRLHHLGATHRCIQYPSWYRMMLLAYVAVANPLRVRCRVRPIPQASMKK